MARPVWPAHPDDDLTSRSDLRRANRGVEETLARLSRDLVELSQKQLAALELPEALLDAVRGVQAIKSPAARQRQLRLVRVLLRDAEWAPLKERVAELQESGSIAPRSANEEGD